MQHARKIMTRHSATLTHDEATLATGRDPKELGGMATPADGTPRGETVKIIEMPLPETVGNVEHTFGTVEGIRGWQKP